MVQRKAAKKFGIQPDSKKNHVKSEKRFVALKPSSQHQDMRNKGGDDLKKRMKKARSFKALELERLESPPSREYLRFEKPSVDTPSAATPQKKLSPINVVGRCPNYMKPTSSSDARKENLQVSPDNVQSSTRNSKYSKSSASGLKTMKVLTKSSSLKPVRSSMKKSSSVSLYPQLNVNRATCSSTLKDSKFPVSVMLHPGGTESEGTSVMKVCPYTYCSLNGHHHEPLPPLKHFLSARRRLLRTQKSMRLKGLSPVRIKCSGKSKNEIDTGQMAFGGDPAVLELDPVASTISPLIEEVDTDFFVKIYVKSSEEITESVSYDNGINMHCDGDEEPKFEFSANSQVFVEVSSVGDDEVVHRSSDGTDKETEDDRIADTQIDGPYKKISFEDDSDFPQAEMESESSDGEEIIAEIDFDGSAPEAADMDWEEQVNVVPYPDNGSECSMFDDDVSEFTTVFLPWSDNLGLDDELVSVADETVSVGTYGEGLENEEMLREMPKEDAESFLAAFGSGSSEGNNPGLENGNQSSEIDECGNFSGEVFNVSNGLIQNQLMEVLDLNPKHMEPEPSDEYDHNSIESISSSTPSASSAFEELIEASEDGNLREDFLQGHNLLKEGNEGRFDEQSFTPDERDQSSEIDESENGSEEVFDISNGLIQNQLVEILDLNPEQIEPEPSNEYDHDIIEIEYTSIPMASSAAFEEPTKPSEENGNPKDNEFLQGQNLLKGGKEDSLDEQNCSPHVTHRTIINEQEHESLPVEMEDKITDEDQATNDHSPEHALSRTDVEDGSEMKEQLEDAYGSLKIRTSDQDITMEDQNTGQLKIDIEACLCDIIIEDEKCGEHTVLDPNSNVPDQCLSPKTSDCSADDQLDIGNVVQNQEGSENDQSKLAYNEECSGMERKGPSFAEERLESNDKMHIEDDTKLEAAETSLAADIKFPEEDKNIIDTGTEPEQSLPKTSSNNRGRKLVRYAENMEQVREFNPRAPHYLLIEPDPEAEKVDLRHQEMDDRKNSEEWMLDYALQRAVSKLAPARKRRVSLLVEAFETVIPIPKYETHLRRPTFTHARPIQACS